MTLKAYGFGPTRTTFEDWTAVGVAFGNEHFPDWHPKMIQRMANDFAWRAEGVSITPESIESTWQDWISGSSPYSPHTVPRDGYDYILWGEVMEQKSYHKLTAFAEEKFASEPMNIDRFINGVKNSTDITILHDDEMESAYQKFQQGAVPYSPHYVPLEPEHVQNRIERIGVLRERYSKTSDFSFRLFYHNRHGGQYGPLQTHSVIDNALRRN